MKQVEIATSRKLKWLTEEEEEKVRENRKTIARQNVKGEKTDDVYEGKEVPLSTTHLIEFVIKKQTKGTHGEPQGVPVSDQRKIFKILDKIESLPQDATSIELEDAEYAFVGKKIKAYKDRWWTTDRIFDQFETAFGVVEEEEKE